VWDKMPKALTRPVDVLSKTDESLASACRYVNAALDVEGYVIQVSVEGCLIQVSVCVYLDPQVVRLAEFQEEGRPSRPDFSND
jgi:hypothetical protein